MLIRQTHFKFKMLSADGLQKVVVQNLSKNT